MATKSPPRWDLDFLDFLDLDFLDLDFLDLDFLDLDFLDFLLRLIFLLPPVRAPLPHTGWSGWPLTIWPPIIAGGALSSYAL